VTRKGSLAVLLKERHRPSLPSQHELHQHSVAGRTACAVSLPRPPVRLRWQRNLAGAADLARQPHPGRRCTFPTHRRILGENTVEVQTGMQAYDSKMSRSNRSHRGGVPNWAAARRFGCTPS
jgi:hypothetical protein